MPLRELRSGSFHKRPATSVNRQHLREVHAVCRTLSAGESNGSPIRSYIIGFNASHLIRKPRQHAGALVTPRLNARRRGPAPFLRSLRSRMRDRLAMNYGCGSPLLCCYRNTQNILTLVALLKAICYFWSSVGRRVGGGIGRQFARI
jgi:hypothetical protein